MACRTILFLLGLMSTSGYSQVMVDTIQFKPIVTKSVKTVSELNLRVIDTLHQPLAYILTESEAPEVIAVRRQNHFIVFDLLPDPEYGVITKINQMVLNDVGYTGLVVYSDETHGHSGLGGGMRSTLKTVLVYNLDSLELIFESEYFNSNYQWVNDISDELEVLSTTEYEECYEFTVKLTPSQIQLNLKTDGLCTVRDTTDFVATRWIYDLHKDSYNGKGYKK